MPNSQPLPRFIHTLEQCWPFVSSLPGCRMFTASFDPAALTTEDITRYGLRAIGSNRKRQSEFLAGRLCAARALDSNLLPVRDVASGLPVWPIGCCGSITHSNGLAAAVAAARSNWKGLGLDIERILKAKRAMRLRKAILTEEEHDWLSAETEEDAAQLTTLFFSAKESLYKAINPLTGVFFGFQDARVIEYRQDGQLTLQLLRDLTDEYRNGMEFPCLWTPYGHGLLTLVYLAA